MKHESPTFGCLPPGPWESAYICAFDAMRRRAERAEARVRELEARLLPHPAPVESVDEALERVLREGTPF